MLTPTGDMDLRKIGQARNTLMDVKLSQVFIIIFCNNLSIHLFIYTEVYIDDTALELLPIVF